MILGRYGRKIDVWGCGIMFYLMIYGCLPFTGHTDEDLFQSIIEREPLWSDSSVICADARHKTGLAAFAVTSARFTQDFRDHKFSGKHGKHPPPTGGDNNAEPSYSPSVEAQSFCALLLSKNVRSRPTAGEALRNPWLTEMVNHKDHSKGDSTAAVPLSIRSYAHKASTKIRYDTQQLSGAEVMKVQQKMDDDLSTIMIDAQHKGKRRKTPGKDGSKGASEATGSHAETSFDEAPRKIERLATRANVQAYQELQQEMAAARLKSRTASRAGTFAVPPEKQGRTVDYPEETVYDSKGPQRVMFTLPESPDAKQESESEDDEYSDESSD
eukprot:Selendium_serpulae@DN6128_c0_g1_i3.p1